MSYHVLMVCTGNICRSPMAEGLLREQLPLDLQSTVSVASAGTHGLHGNRAEPFAVEAAAGLGADIGDHRARILDRQLVRTADLVLTMEQAHIDWINDLFFRRCRHAQLLGSFDPDRGRLEIDDPYGLDQMAYTACAAEIAACLPGLIDHIHTRMAGQQS